MAIKTASQAAQPNQPDPGPYWLSCLATRFYSHQSKISNKIYSEPLMNALSPCKGPNKSFSVLFKVHQVCCDSELQFSEFFPDHAHHTHDHYSPPVETYPSTSYSDSYYPTTSYDSPVIICKCQISFYLFHLIKNLLFINDK